MISTRSSKFKHIFFAFLYCLVFFIFRVKTSSTLTPDEAEQFFYAKEFSLSYSNQAPLITWIYFLVDQFFSLNVITINSVKYLCYFLFLVFYALIIDRTIKQELKTSCFLSLFLIPLYSFYFHKDLLHSILVACLATATVYLCILLKNHKNTFSYFLLGVSVAFGILSKYNFVFLAVAILLSFLYRKDFRDSLFINYRFLVFLATLTLFIYPHLIDLTNNGLSSIVHAQNKAHSAEWNISTITDGLLKIIVVFAIPAISFLFFQIKKRRGLINLVTIFSFGFLLLFYFLLQIKSFSSHWLAPLAFLVPLLYFKNLEPRSKLITRAYTLILIIFITILSTIFLLPDKHLRTTDIDFVGITKKLESIYGNEEVIFVSNNIFLLSNIEAHSNYKTFWLEKLSYDYYSCKEERIEDIKDYAKDLNQIDKKIVLILMKKDIKKERLPRRFRYIFGDLQYQHKLFNPYLTKTKKKFKYYLWEPKTIEFSY